MTTLGLIGLGRIGAFHAEICISTHGRRAPQQNAGRIPRAFAIERSSAAGGPCTTRPAPGAWRSCAG